MEIKKSAKEFKDENKQIKVLKEIITTISYNLDLNEILDRILLITKEITKSDSCFLYILEEDFLILKASQNPHKEFVGRLKLKVGEGITGWVAKYKKTVCLEEAAYQDKKFKTITSLPEDKYEAFLSVPITFGEKFIGIINVQHIKKKKYRLDEVSLVEMIAQVVGGALERARLISETNLLKEALETRKSVDKAKAILMRDYNFSEQEAHKLLIKKSMDKRKSLKEIAQAIILVDELAKK
ncbi:MAG: ANTAR domain-containing protein [bacterium]